MTRAPSPATMLGLVLAALVVSAWFPFRPGFEGPYLARNGAVRQASGALEVAEPAFARTDGPPTWLAAAPTARSFALTLEVQATSDDQRGPARILTLSRDSRTINLMVGQEGTALVVRVRRPGGGQDGEPRLEVPGVFARADSLEAPWRSIAVSASGGTLRVAVDGVERASEPSTSTPCAAWSTDQRLAFGDEHTRSRPWNGVVRRAEFLLDGVAHDLLAPAELEVPRRVLEVPERAREALALERHDLVATALWHVAIFVPFGWALARWRAGRNGRSTTWVQVLGHAVPLSLALEVGKLLFAARHPSLLHVVPDGIGAWLGTLVAVRTAREGMPAKGARITASGEEVRLTVGGTTELPS